MTEYPRQPSRRLEAFSASRRTPSHERWLRLVRGLHDAALRVLSRRMYAISSVDAMKLTKVAHALQVAFDDSAHGRSLAAGSGVMPERGLAAGAGRRDRPRHARGRHARPRRGNPGASPRRRRRPAGSRAVDSGGRIVRAGQRRAVPDRACRLISLVAATVPRVPPRRCASRPTGDSRSHGALPGPTGDLLNLSRGERDRSLIERASKRRRLVAAGYAGSARACRNMTPAGAARGIVRVERREFSMT